MANIDLHKEYNSSGVSVQHLFDVTEEGFFVPEYQREYTWEEDNINQFFEDLVFGTRELAENKNATTFLGTTILTPMIMDKNRTVKPGEERAQPTAVQLVIDGQQRFSTLALISIQLIDKLGYLLDRLPTESPYAEFHNSKDNYIDKLKKLHTIDLKRGSDPPFKPKIIREREDRWTFDGSDDTYQSPVAGYIAHYIRTNCASAALSNLMHLTNAERVQGNVKHIDRWINAICDAHIPNSMLYGQFPTGEKIASDSIHQIIFGYEDSNVKSVVKASEINKDCIGTLNSWSRNHHICVSPRLVRQATSSIESTEPNGGK